MKRKIDLLMHKSGAVTNRTPQQRLFRGENKATKVVAFFERGCFEIGGCDCFKDFEFNIEFALQDCIEVYPNKTQPIVVKPVNRSIEFTLGWDILEKAGVVEMTVIATDAIKNVTMKWTPVLFRVINVANIEDLPDSDSVRSGIWAYLNQAKAILINVQERHGNVIERHRDIETRHKNVIDRHGDIETRHKNVIDRHRDTRTRHKNVIDRHGDIETRYKNVIDRHGDIETRHKNVIDRHGDIETRHMEVSDTYKSIMHNPSHKWDGTSLQFRHANGNWGDLVDLQGPIGPAGPQGLQGERGPAGPPGSGGGGGEGGAGNTVQLETVNYELEIMGLFKQLMDLTGIFDIGQLILEYLGEYGISEEDEEFGYNQFTVNILSQLNAALLTDTVLNAGGIRELLSEPMDFPFVGRFEFLALPPSIRDGDNIWIDIQLHHIGYSSWVVSENLIFTFNEWWPDEATIAIDWPYFWGGFNFNVILLSRSMQIQEWGEDLGFPVLLFVGESRPYGTYTNEWAHVSSVKLIRG